MRIGNISIEREDIYSTIINKKHVYDASELNKWVFVEMQWDEAMAVLHAYASPQKSSPIIERIVKKSLRLDKKKGDDHGDASVSVRNPYLIGLMSSNNLEIKNSSITPNKRSFRVVQIRPWQNVDYILVFNDLRPLYNRSPVITKVFFLTNRQMKNEMDTIGVSNAHQSTKRNAENKTSEKMFSIPVESNHFLRWTRMYYNANLTSVIVNYANNRLI